MDMIPLYSLSSQKKSAVYSSGKWIDGIYTKKVEEKLKNYLKVKHVILTNSGTSALLAAYWLLKKQGHKTIDVDPYTFPATYQAARFLNYKVNFSRLMLNNNILKPSDIQVLVHLFGQPDDRVNTFPSEKIIEDACQSFGAEINGKKVGTLGEFGCFSFYPTKILHTAGHGGALVFNNSQYFEDAKKLIESGRYQGQLTESIGLNLRIDEIKAEFLLDELKYIDKRIEIQRDIAFQFKKLIPIYQPFLTEKPNQKNVYSVFNLLISKRDEFRLFMKKKNIDTMVYYDKNVLPKKLVNLYDDITNHIVSIPCRWNLSKGEIKIIKEALKEWFILNES